MRILIATDAWLPQTNGVVSTLRHTAEQLSGFGHEVRVLSPLDCNAVPLRATYAGLRWFHSAGRRCMVSTVSMHRDLARAAGRALRADPASCRRKGESADWAACTRQFLSHLVPARAF